MNAIELSIVWCVVQVTIVCSVTLTLGELYRRIAGHRIASLGQLALIIVLCLTAMAFSPWPSWSSDRQRAVTVSPANIIPHTELPSDTSTVWPTESTADARQVAPTRWRDRLSNASDRLANVVGGLAKITVPLLVLSIAIGGLRFLVGLIAVSGTARNSQVIDDDKINSLMDELRQQLGCSRATCLRESKLIGSPATVGWRNPTILLPMEWRGWSTTETRAVLAHEIAHVARNDFGSLLIAQLTTVFHFYHPLVHRLVEGLRLEQELAADAAAASAVGGNKTYLTVLATMALHNRSNHQNSARTPWPARPFLPAPKTLLRRIEMLQTTKPSFTPAPKKARIAAIAIILVAGVVAAGLRPVTAIAQEDAKPVVDEQSEAEDIRAIIQAKFDKRKWSDLTEAEREEFGLLSTRNYEQNPDDAAAKNLYADYLIASGDLVKAFPILKDLSQSNPLRGLQAAAVARRLKMYEEADAIAERTLDAMKKYADRDPKNLSVALAVSQNQIFLKRFDEAINTLDKAIKLAKTPQEKELAGQAFGDAIVAHVSHIEDNSKGNDGNAKIAALLRQALRENDSPGVAHFIKGITALMEGDYETGMRELKLAQEHMPLSSAVMNNLAVVMLKNESVDPGQPLKIINVAIKTTKKPPPHYYETRGQILMRMERYEEAIPDLKRALTVPSLAKKAHQDLATCYEKIGDADNAEIHAQAAEALEAE